MRVQSSFEKLAEGASQKVFAFCFIAMRIVLGIGCLYLVSQLMQDSTYIDHPGDLKVFTSIVAPIFASVGVSFVLGLLVRPVAVMCALLLLINIVSQGPTDSDEVMTHGIVILLFLLFAAGGSGHVLGIDGVISRNIRRPNVFTKFLFG